MSPALNGSSALQRFERSNAIEIRNGIMFDFYLGLPHMYSLITPRFTYNFLLKMVLDLYTYWELSCNKFTPFSV